MPFFTIYVKDSVSCRSSFPHIRAEWGFVSSLAILHSCSGICFIPFFTIHIQGFVSCHSSPHLLAGWDFVSSHGVFHLMVFFTSWCSSPQGVLHVYKGICITFLHGILAWHFDMILWYGTLAWHLVWNFGRAFWLVILTGQFSREFLHSILA